MSCREGPYSHHRGEMSVCVPTLLLQGRDSQKVDQYGAQASNNVCRLKSSSGTRRTDCNAALEKAGEGREGPGLRAAGAG